MNNRAVAEVPRAGPSRTGSTVALFVVAALLVLASLMLGFTSVNGNEEGESFQCGTPFLSDNSESYRGTDGFATCERTRSSRTLWALAGLGVGLGVGAYAGLGSRRHSEA